MKIHQGFLQLRNKVASRLAYDSTTGVFIWINPPKSHPDLLGQKAGALRNGYLIIKIDGKAYRAHQLAWLLARGHIPDVIDHRNRNTLDNRLCNLREATRLQNAQNHTRKRKASGLPHGVRVTPYGKYVARIRDNKRPLHLGTFKTAEEAAQAYLQAQKKYFGDFAPL